MTEPDWKRAKVIFGEAVALAAGERGVFLDEACGGDAALRDLVEELLSSHESVGDYMGAPTGDANGAAGRGAGTERIGEKIGPYTLVRVIGEGGFGVVYEAQQDEPLSRRVAIKVIKLGMDTRQVIARFEQERRALAVMDHPSIARVFDAGATASGRPYFVMELIEGVPITRYCDEQRLTPRERLELFIPVCQAVQHAHTKGIIHRDIKPSNVLVTVQDGKAVPKVIDFGVAKATAQGSEERTAFTDLRQFIGTPEYMSPEQAGMGDRADGGGVDIDTRSDVYSLGVLLYELLVGATPFDARQLRSAAFAEMQRIIREVDPPKPSTRLSTLETLASVAACRRVEPRRMGALVRGDLDWIVMKCLEKDRARRYETANGLAADVQRHLNGEAVVAAPPSRSYRMRRFVSRHRTRVAAVALLTVALLLGLTGTAWAARVARQERDRALAAEREANQRAVDSKLISDFATQMFGNVPEELGRQLDQEIVSQYGIALDREGVREPERTARIDALSRELQKVNTNDVTFAVIDRQILQPAIKNIDNIFRDRPLAAVTVRHSLFDVYLGQGMYDAAAPLLDGAIETRRSLLGPDDPLTIDSLDNKGYVLVVMHKATEAEPLLREALERSTRVKGAEDERTIDYKMHLAMALQELGRRSDAESLLREVKDGFERVLGADASLTLTSLEIFGNLLSEEGKWDDAEALYREGLRRSRRAHLTTNSEALAFGLGALLARRGDADGAVRYLRESLAERRIRGDESQTTTGRMALLGALLLKQGTVATGAEAESILRVCLAGREKLFPSGHKQRWLRYNTLSMLGEALLLQGAFEKAEPLLLEGFSGLKDDPAVPLPPLAGGDRKREALERIVRLYEAWDKAEPGKGYDAKAADWRAKLDASTPAPIPAPEPGK